MIETDYQPSPFAAPQSDPGSLERWYVFTIALCTMLASQTGSARYMAPEVALEFPYHRPSEVYSWALIFWQLSARQKPFDGMSFAQHLEQV